MHTTQTRPNLPNVIVILTDQQRADSLSCYGSTFTHTPNVDRLAAEGILFERAYCANPVCTPARISLFTGRQVSRHGAWNVGINASEDTVTAAHLLNSQGYRTHYIGKAHFQAFGASPEQSQEAISGWEQRFPQFSGPYYGFESVELALGHTTGGLAGHYGVWVRSQVDEETFKSFGHATRLSPIHFGGEACDWDLPLRYHNSVWTASRGVDFLQRRDGSEPFMLVLSFQDPHHPHALPRDFTNRVSPAQVPLPDYVEGELDTEEFGPKPPFFARAHRGDLENSDVRGRFPIAGQGRGADFGQISGEDARLGRAYYYSMVRLMDEQLGRVLDALDEGGLTENTLVIFTTDHGELLGDHGLWMKGPFHYEQLIRVPMLMRWPNGFSGNARSSALLSHVDVFPTILTAAGLEVPDDIDGVSALPLLRGNTADIRDRALVECVDDPRKLRLKTVVTRDRKLTWYHGHDYGELYDLERDPRERINLWDDSKYAREKTTLLSRILDSQEPLEKRNVRYSYA